MHIDLEWADEHYLSTLLDIIGETGKLGEKPKKKKVSSSNIGKFITD